MKVKNTPEPRVEEQTNPSRVAEPSPSQSIPLGPLPGSAMDLPDVSNQTDAEIKELAYRLYEDRGCVDGWDLEDWLEAESIVRQGGKSAA